MHITFCKIRKKLELYELLQHTSSFLLLPAIRTHIIPFINWINSILNLFQLLCTYFGKLFKNLTAVNTGNLIMTNLQLSKARLVLSLLFPTDFPCCTKAVRCVSYSLFFSSISEMFSFSCVLMLFPDFVWSTNFISLLLLHFGHSF